MAITVTMDEGLCRIAIDGEMTIFVAQELRDALLEPLAASQDIEVDLSAVSEIDAAGLQLMVMAKLETIIQHKTLRFSGHSAPVQEILDLSNLASFFGDPVVIQSQSA